MKNLSLQPIKLTTEQKEELINLCKKQFPDYPFQFWKLNWTAHSERDSDYLGFIRDDIGYVKDEFALEIHWFEFVVRMAIDEERDEFMNFYLNVCSPDETETPNT